jgi:hypothetical protein
LIFGIDFVGEIIKEKKLEKKKQEKVKNYQFNIGKIFLYLVGYLRLDFHPLANGLRNIIQSKNLAK